MNQIFANFSVPLATVVFTSVAILHLIKKNHLAVWWYVVQSSAVVILLLSSAVKAPSFLAFIAIIATIGVKIIIAPYFFFELIKKHQLKFSVTTYLNMPLTLFVIAVLGAITRTDFFWPLGQLAGSNTNACFIAFSAIAISLFLIVNRKGALSQMLGVLSLENSIVTFALFAGLEQSPALQLGITFDILLWVTISAVFISMLYKHFGTLNVTTLQKLHD